MAIGPQGAEYNITRIRKVIAGQETKFRTAFQLAINNIRNALTLEQLADLLEARQFEQALSTLEIAGDVLGGQYGASVSEAARDSAKWLSEVLDVTVSFDQVNVRAVAIMQQNRLRLISEFTTEQRDVLRNIFVRGTERGLNPQAQAREFRSSVGLTNRQAAAVQRFRDLLSIDGSPSRDVLTRRLRDKRFDSTIRNAANNKTPLTSEQIDTMVDRYRQRYIKYRAEVIGRTEALRSVHQGTEELFRQAVDSGQIDGDKISRKWNAARDSRVRDSHTRLSGQIRGLGETWLGDEGELRYPADPEAPASETVQCRCAISTRILA